MAVIATDMLMKLSGGATNSNVNASLGGERSSVSVNFGTPMNNLYDNVPSSEATAGMTDYRCIYLMNNNGADSIDNVALFVSSDTPSATTKIQIGLDPAGIGDGAATGVATTVADELSAPAGVTFSDAAGAGNALPVGTLGPGEGVAVWLKRIVNAGTASAASDPFTLRMTGTPA